MNRSKSAGVFTATRVSNEEIRSMCKRVAPYIVHQWRDVCEELGVADAVLDDLQHDLHRARKSELAFQGLCRWQEMAGRTANKDKLLRVVAQLGLKRAEDELRAMSQSKRTVPFMGRPATAAATQDVPVNRQTKQKALADRLSRPKSNSSLDQEAKKPSKPVQQVTSGINPLILQQISPSKANDICEVKLKITLKGMQKLGKDEMESTKDEFKSTKDDYKQACHIFVKLVMGNQKAHFRELKQLLGFSGISIQKLTKIGFNINMFILCHGLGAFEILHQSYTTGRLKKIVHSTLVTETYLHKLNARLLELSVDIDEGLVHKYRDMLLTREVQEVTAYHPVDDLDYFQCDTDEESGPGEEPDHVAIKTFDMCAWNKELRLKIAELDERYRVFNGSMKDLIMTLRIIRPSDTHELSCLHDVIHYYQYLRNSQSVGQGSGTGLVQEYLAIVNQVRLKVNEINEKDLFISFDETLHPYGCESFHRQLTQLEEMLQPTYKFEAGERSVTTHALTGMEQEMFGGLLCYVPRLIELLNFVSDSLTKETQIDCADDDYGVENEQDKTVDENKENIDSNQGGNKTCSMHNGDNINIDSKGKLTQSTTVNYIQTWTPS